jgi:hypothetical protein
MPQKYFKAVNLPPFTALRGRKAVKRLSNCGSLQQSHRMTYFVDFAGFFLQITIRAVKERLKDYREHDFTKDGSKSGTLLEEVEDPAEEPGGKVLRPTL